jgi:hypothetical protein
MKKPTFSQIVSGAEYSESAFDSYGPARLWWRAILWLHGKPTSPQLETQQRQQIIADGFRFYAQLYRTLAVLFWIVGAAVYGVDIFDTSRDALYWTGAAALSGGLLWFASGLGFAGAKALRENDDSARFLLCTFMVCIIAFLSAFIAGSSLVLHIQSGFGAVWNLGVVVLTGAFGIGSYLIEVLYLVSETNSNL